MVMLRDAVGHLDMGARGVRTARMRPGAGDPMLRGASHGERSRWMSEII